MKKRTNKPEPNRAKRPPTQKLVVSKKTVKQDITPNSYFSKSPRWLFRRHDFNHEKWGMAPCAVELSNIFRYLSDLETQKWSEILSSTSGRRGNTRNHNIEITRLCREAQKRAQEIGLDEFDELCSLALGSLQRVWGYISEGDFYIIWFDTRHEIYPV